MIYSADELISLLVSSSSYMPFVLEIVACGGFRIVVLTPRAEENHCDATPELSGTNLVVVFNGVPW